MPHGIRLLLCAAIVVVAESAAAQTYSAGADLLFYGDNTEFANPFRAGDTTLGASGKIFLEAALNDAVTVRGGVFVLGRFGAHDAFDHAEPVIALQISRGHSRFIFGSIETASTSHDVNGPDLETPHRLLPPIQQETLTFSRGQEMGLQWIVESGEFQHDAWINWQRLNSETDRERFDAGYRSSTAVARNLRLHGQWHVVHEGGQRFDNGAVSDSQAAALGLEWSHAGRARSTLEAFVVGSRDVPDRADPQRSASGAGVFTRGALGFKAWRSHLIIWRARHLTKAEGDPNYLALRRNGSRFGKVRDYAEWGLTRHFRPARDVHVFAAFRVHRVESSYEYSYRNVGRVRLRHQF